MCRSEQRLQYFAKFKIWFVVSIWFDAFVALCVCETNETLVKCVVLHCWFAIFVISMNQNEVSWTEFQIYKIFMILSRMCFLSCSFSFSRSMFRLALEITFIFYAFIWNFSFYFMDLLQVFYYKIRLRKTWKTKWKKRRKFYPHNSLLLRH